MNSVYIIFKRFGTRRVLKIRSSRGIEIIGASACIERPHGWPKMVESVSMKTVMSGRSSWSRSRRSSSSSSSSSTGSSSGSSSSTSSCSRRSNSVVKEKIPNAVAQPNSSSVAGAKTLEKDGDLKGVTGTVRNDNVLLAASKISPTVELVVPVANKPMSSFKIPSHGSKKIVDPIIVSDSDCGRSPQRDVEKSSNNNGLSKAVILRCFLFQMICVLLGWR